MRDSAISTRTSSTIWRCDRRQVAHQRVGVDGQAEALGRLDDPGAGGAGRRRPVPVDSSMFSSTVKAGTRRRSWNTMPMP